MELWPGLGRLEGSRGLGYMVQGLGINGLGFWDKRFRV